MCIISMQLDMCIDREDLPKFLVSGHQRDILKDNQG